MAFVLSFLTPLIPYILGAVGLVALYFGIKQRGVKAERAKWQEKAEAIANEFKKAESKDSAIDEKVKQQIEAIKKTEAEPVDSGDRFKF